MKLQPLNSDIPDVNGFFSFYILLELLSAQVKDFRQHVSGALWFKKLTKLAFKQKRRKS